MKVNICTGPLITCIDQSVILCMKNNLPNEVHNYVFILEKKILLKLYVAATRYANYYIDHINKLIYAA